MIGVDLFAGAGGMSLGASQAGISVALAVEADGHAAGTYAQNHPETVLFSHDVRKFAGSELKRLPRKGGTVLFGGPPCQGFSYSNSRTRGVGNPENWLFLEFLRIARVWEPDWIIFENVRGIADTDGGYFLRELLERLDSERYSLTCGVLSASDFGVPQYRYRLFVVGSRVGLRVPLPKPVAGKSPTVAAAIGDLPQLDNGHSKCCMPYGAAAPSAYARGLRGGAKNSCNHLVTRNAGYVVGRYKHVPQGGNWANIPARLMRNYGDRQRCHTGVYHRLAMDKPSIVIGNFRKNMLIHPVEDRGLSVREAARIQSFPDTYVFKGSIGFQQQQVGNAVPPKLAEAVFGQVCRASGIEE